MLPFDLFELIKTVSYFGLFGIIFAESGLLFGFFLPGDSLLFTAGFLAKQGDLNLWVVIVGCFIAAVAGDSVGYSFGKRFGKRLFNKEDSLFFHKDHILRAEAFYEKHGGKTIILARFMPVIRTFAPIVAGIGGMQYTRFLMFNVIGAVLWAIGLPLAGYFLGSIIPEDKVDHYLLPVIAIIVFVSVAPGVYHVFKEKENRDKLLALVMQRLRKSS